ncbi:MULTISPECIES: sugar phosphate isomerase/epimerase [unclassified Nocardia]|uniref:sugar phosphate isomerase/epimerase family protein n=1 Tax=unclassified Nocardia TaxID=2637762 RepID=UPI001CE45086|nr:MULTISPECIES: hypothetical protein [unclassified Nocardia]
MTALALPQWRLDTDRGIAIRRALRHGIVRVHLDFGGAHRGPRLDDPRTLRATARAMAGVEVPVLAVNHVNDVGMFGDSGGFASHCLRLVESAIQVAAELGIPTVHIPSFRASAVTDAAKLRIAAEFLAATVTYARGFGIGVASESGLGAADLALLYRLTGARELAIVVDTGNLVDAGHDIPEVFALAGTVRLHPDIHVKAPTAPGAPPLSELIAHQLLPYHRPAAVLLENDYRASESVLIRDLAWARATFRARSGGSAAS